MAEEIEGLKELLTQRMNHLEERLAEHTRNSLEHYQQIQRQFDQARAQIVRDQTLAMERTKETGDALSLRLDEMNALRRQIEQERNLYVTRDRLDQAVSSIEQRIDDAARERGKRLDEVNTRMSDLERAKANLDGRFAMLGLVLFVVSVCLNLVLSYWSHNR